MSLTVRAHFDGKAIVPNEPLDLPQDRELEVEVRFVTRAGRRRRAGRGASRVTSMAFFGMWADREDMMDAAAWVHKERERWNERLQSPR